MKHILTAATLCLLALTAAAEDEKLENGLLGDLLDRVEYGRKVTQWAEKPVIGAYYVGAYKYSTDADGNTGFQNRFARVYANWRLLKDFECRAQVEFAATTPHLKDVWVEYQRLSWLRVRVGQMKRIFTFENPYHTWEAGVGDFGQVTKALAGYSDYTAAENTYSTSGIDAGLQLQGDLVAVRGVNLLHYQVGVFNGQGANNKDANGKKDWMGTVQLQPVKDLYIGVFGWRGTYTKDDVTVGRNRWAAGAKYETDRLSLRAEYAHHTGHKVSDWDADTQTWSGNARADGWYATAGYAPTPWLKVYVRYDAYRPDATNETLSTIYSVCPNFQLHKNLKLQVQYNYVTNNATNSRAHELWAQTYFRL